MSIGELAKQTGVSVAAIRFYEERGLLPHPVRQPNNRRSYGPDFVVALSLVGGVVVVAWTCTPSKSCKCPCKAMAMFARTAVPCCAMRLKD